MITTAELRIRYREFSDADMYPDSKLQLYINDAVILMADEHRWFDWYNQAQAALVGHLMYIADSSESGDGGIIAPMKKQDVDDVVIEQAVNAVDVTGLDYYATIYGQTYMRYVRMTFTGIFGI